MFSISKLDKNKIIEVKHENDLDLAKPFEKEILLLETYVAGTRYIEGLDELAQYLEVDEKLYLYREIDNAYDPKAIIVKNDNDIKLGYIPRHDNLILSRLMDAGKLLYAKITDLDNGYYGDNIEIEIEVYLKD